MPTLTIDDRQITVPEGTNVLEAGKMLGIMVPHFCYHEALGAVGACRQCAVVFLEGPVKGLQMSCMIKAQDGMVVSTLHPRATELRKHVAEWLMVNHPHDCPVCDEGGECLLQDMTIAAGHGIRRYRGRKRTYNNQYLGPFLWHEMNRCIQCYRCVRTYQDYCGGTDFGVLGCNQRLYFGRFRDGTLESRFAGNLADVCPTGVFTDKTFRYRARYWDLQEAPSICPHCSLGCAIIPGARYRELQRVRAGTNRQTNGWFICDRGRFGYGYANHPQRPRLALVDGREADWSRAAAELRRRLREIAGKHGALAVALLGSPRASLEANFQLQQLARALETDRLAFDPHPGHDQAARTAAALLGSRARSLEEVRRSDFLLFVGIDPLNEGPGLALAARQAVRRGGAAAIIDPRPIELPFASVHLPIEPKKLIAALSAFDSAQPPEGFSRQEASVLAGIAARLRQAKHPVLAGGVDLLGAAGVRKLLETAQSLDSPERPCGAAVLLGGPNSFGGALLAGEGPDFNGLLAGIEAGEIRALLCLEGDPFADHPDPHRVEKALGKLELLAVLDCLPTRAAAQATILLPTRTPAEGAGTYVNNEGRMLPFAAVFEPGVPLEITGDGGHPPRRFEAETPGSEPRPAWAAIASLQEETVSLEKIRAVMEQADPRFAGLAGLDPQGEGVRVAGGLPAPPSLAAEEKPEGDTLFLLATASLYASESFAACSPVLDEVRPAPHLVIHVDDAARLGLAAGDRARLFSAIGQFDLPVRLSSAMAPGVVIVPHLRGTPLAQFVPGGGALPCRLQKEVAP